MAVVDASVATSGTESGGVTAVQSGAEQGVRPVIGDDKFTG